MFSRTTIRLATDATILRKPLKDLLAFDSEAEVIDLPEPPATTIEPQLLFMMEEALITKITRSTAFGLF